MDKMNELGYEVDMFCQDPILNFHEKVFCKFDEDYLIRKSIKLQTGYIEKLKKQNKHYDYIFVIKGEKLDHRFLMTLKQMNSQAKFILYLWDDIERVGNFHQNRSIFNKIYSFDKNDSIRYKLLFLPLFFCDEFEKNNQEKKIDIYFSGWEHSDRRQILDKLIPMLETNNIKYYFHLYTGRFNVLKQKIKTKNFKRKPGYIKFQLLSLKENAELTIISRTIIDIQHVSQNGLTMRTIESLASKTKLITTNNNIKEYDFFNPQNTVIIDRENPKIDLEFIRSPYIDVPNEVLLKYSLTNWVKTILD